jgi:hypothetical protein
MRLWEDIKPMAVWRCKYASEKNHHYKRQYVDEKR